MIRTERDRSVAPTFEDRPHTDEVNSWHAQFISTKYHGDLQRFPSHLTSVSSGKKQKVSHVLSQSLVYTFFPVRPSSLPLIVTNRQVSRNKTNTSRFPVFSDVIAGNVVLDVKQLLNPWRNNRQKGRRKPEWPQKAMEGSIFILMEQTKLIHQFTENDSWFTLYNSKLPLIRIIRLLGGLVSNKILEGRGIIQGEAEIIKNFKILVACFSATVSRSAGVWT